MQFGGRSRPSTPKIAQALDVDAVVEGSVSRSGDRVRITAQLIDARADRHLWAKSFEGNSSDVLGLQAELASAIAREIDVRLTEREQARLAAARSVNPEAYDAYLKGRYFFNRPSDENLQKAITQFEETVRLSPTFASGYSGLSDAYLWAGYNEGFLTSSQAKPKAGQPPRRQWSWTAPPPKRTPRSPRSSSSMNTTGRAASANSGEPSRSTRTTPSRTISSACCWR
jgi:hypothetical protein